MRKYLFLTVLALLFCGSFIGAEFTAKDPGKHPYLFFDAKEFDDYRALIKSSSSAKADYAAMLRISKATLDKPIALPTKEVKGFAYAPGSPALREHMDLAGNLVRLGFAYQIDGKKEYALKVREALLAYADKYVSFYMPMKKNQNFGIFSQILEESAWVIGICFAYDMIADSGVLSEAEQKHIENDLLKETAKLIRFWPSDTNWGGYMMAASGLIGFTVKDTALINRSLNGETGFPGFKEFLDKGITEGGLWVEGTIGYHWPATRTLIYFMEASRHWGVDFYSYDNNKVKKLFDAPVVWAYPDYTIPGMNDSGRGELFEADSQPLYSYAYLRYKDPMHLFILNNSKSSMLTGSAMFWSGWLPTRIYDQKLDTKLPPLKSDFLGGTDLAILKDGAWGDGRYLLLDCGTNGHGHSHKDCLSMLYFAKDTSFIIEPTSIGYNDPRHDSFSIQTIAHSTVNIDERGQKKVENAKADLAVFNVGPKAKIAKGKASPDVYGGKVEANRTVMLLPDYFADFFWIDGKEKSTLDYVLHFENKVEVEDLNLVSLGKIDTKQKPYLEIKDVKSGKTDKELVVTTGKDKKNLLTLKFIKEQGTEIFTGNGPEKPLLIVRRNQPATVFAVAGEAHGAESVIKEVTAAKVTLASKEVQKNDAAGMIVKTKGEDGRIDTIMLAYKSGKYTFEDVVSNCEAGVVSVGIKGGFNFISISNGTYIQAGDKTVETAVPSNIYLEKTGPTSYLLLNTGKTDAEAGLKGFLTGTPAVKLVEAGKQTEVKTAFEGNILKIKLKAGGEYKIN